MRRKRDQLLREYTARMHFDGEELATIEAEQVVELLPPCGENHWYMFRAFVMQWRSDQGLTSAVTMVPFYGTAYSEDENVLAGPSTPAMQVPVGTGEDAVELEGGLITASFYLSSPITQPALSGEVYGTRIGAVENQPLSLVFDGPFEVDAPALDADLWFHVTYRRMRLNPPGELGL